MPILMFGSENWILTEGLIDRLEAFQGELVKRVLKWPKHHSNTAATGCAYYEKQAVGDKVGFPAAGDGERFWKSEWSGSGGTL